MNQVVQEKKCLLSSFCLLWLKSMKWCIATSNKGISSPLLLVASLLLVARPGAPSSVLAPSSDVP